MRVIAGTLKGTSIPFVNEKFDDASVTPQKVKEALFSILGQSLSGKTFLDLYACSGQIGIEAISRNAEFVVFNEIDPVRCKFIKSQIERRGLEDRSRVFRYHAFRCLRYLFSKDFRFDFIYADPPYVKKRGEVPVYNEILGELAKFPVLKEGGKIIFQHFSKNELEEEAGPFSLIDIKRYAGNSLAFYGHFRRVDRQMSS